MCQLTVLKVKGYGYQTKNIQKCFTDHVNVEAACE